jgi:cold-inducible RNA-binding protein
VVDCQASVIFGDDLKLEDSGTVTQTFYSQQKEYITMATRLFVGNLSFNTTEGEILDLFKAAGNVVKCELVMDKFSGKSRGFAFVEMGSQDEATKAIAEINGKDLGGRQLTVNEARPREERPRGDFGGGGGGGYGGGRRDAKREFRGGGRGR